MGEKEEKEGGDRRWIHTDFLFGKIPPKDEFFEGDAGGLKRKKTGRVNGIEGGGKKEFDDFEEGGGKFFTGGGVCFADIEKQGGPSHKEKKGLNNSAKKEK